MPANPAEFREANPGLFYLDPSATESLTAYLQGRGILGSGDSILSVAKAGDGNMNCTLRVTSASRSLIVKQARPWVEKYPWLSAPWDRACREAEFYRVTASCHGVALLMPRLLDVDTAARVLVLEDLGVASDYTGLYRGGTMPLDDIDVVARFLSVLHRQFGPGSAAAGLSNREMRDLNHAHIFIIPLARDNGLNLDALTTGLAAAAEPLKADADYRREVGRLGREAYLGEGTCLIHGDFFPGSLLRTAVGPRIIDPEFAHFGRPEFDVAVLLAHLLLANQPDEVTDRLPKAYLPPPGFDTRTMLQLAGVEIMRRLIGYAQLPLGYGASRKRDLLELSRRLVLEPHPSLVSGYQKSNHEG